MRGQPRHIDDERHTDELLPELEAMPDHMVFAESLAMIARDHDRGVLSPRLCRNEVEKAPDLLIVVPDFAVVEPSRVIAEARRPGVPRVLGVGIQVMNPGKKA